MAENEVEPLEQVDEPHGDEPDYKALYEQTLAQSRKWEQRSKANADKAKKYDEMRGGAESIEDRIAALEADKKRLEDEKVRGELVSKVAESTGLPLAVVASLTGTDEETLTKQCEGISALLPKGAPAAPEAGAFPREKAQTDSEMREFVRKLTGKN